jgi:hypothetical protein
VEGLCVVGRFAVAVGARDDEEIFFAGEFPGIGLGYLEDGGGEGAPAGLGRGDPAEVW